MGSGEVPQETFSNRPIPRNQPVRELDNRKHRAFK